MKMQRLFRATFVDSFSQNTIVVEFDAPYPIDPKVDYAKLAVQELNDMIKLDQIKIRDIEPVEI